MKLIALLCLLPGCVGAGRMAIRFPADENATEISGPASFFCLREGALEGKPTNTLVCVDYARYQREMRELEQQIIKTLPQKPAAEM